MQSDNKPGKEQRTLLVMRKVLSAIIRETTPNPGMKHVLSENTREDIRMCFALITSREHELAEQSGMEIKERPRYADEPKQSSVISIDALKKSNTPSESD
ncbi:MAG: segregation and condensation protein A [Gammaproteobacteria bacterium]|nr:segregation and condensation protein A [Gammaproteobacteria bacterium]